MKSEFLKLNVKDLLKGVLIAVITALLTYFYEVINSGDFTQIHIKTIGITAFSAAVAYLFKNFITNSSGELMKQETPEKFE